MDIGEIVKPQGIRGEVKVIPLTADSSRFRALKTVFVGGKGYRIEGVRISAAGVFIKFVGVDDRNAAELLRGKFISVDRAAAVALDDGEFFIADLTGAELFALEDGGEIAIGTIKRIESFGAADVFTVDCAGGKSMTFAFVKALEPRFDEQSKRLYVLGAALKEVAVYED